ncbi:MAG: hypothetical protein PUK54_06925 [Firmicutes bacterium]|nr:hypothetical protein [Bacillota bacterium]MDY5855605.1 hypothetical protein [Anaerovoracaceae bacterium]
MFSKLGGGGKPEEEKTVTAGTSVIEVIPSSGKTIKKVTVNPTPSQSKTVTPSTSQQTVSPDSGKLLSQVIVKAMEDLAPEVTAQTPMISKILSNLGFTVDSASGTNKQKLQTNNANLAKISDYLPHGAYVWKKYNYSIKPSIVANNQDLHSDGFYIFNSSDYQVTSSDFSLSKLDGGQTVGTSQIIYFTYTDKLYWSYTKGGNDDYQRSVTTNSDNLLIVANNYSCNFTGLTSIEFTEPSVGDFVDFVVSDSETAYPDGGTQDGYWYERVYKCSIKTGTIKPAYNTSSGFSISNPFKRKDKVKFVAIYDTKDTSAVRTLAIIKDFENNYQVAIASDSTYYSSVSLLDTHITVDDSEIKFVPYGNQADFSSVGEYRWEVVGYE